MAHFKALRDCFLFQRSSAELPASRKIWFHVWNWGLVVLMALALGVLALLLACGTRGYEVFYGYFRSPMILLLNLLPPLALMLGLYAATSRAWIAWLVSSVAMLSLPVVNFYMLNFRDDVFMVSDLLLVREGMTIVSNYRIELTPRIWLCIAAVPLGSVLLALLARGRQRWQPRVAVLAVLVLSIWPLAQLYASQTIYDDYTWNYEHLTERRATDRFVGKGYWYPFLHDLFELWGPAEEQAQPEVEITEGGEATVTVQPAESEEEQVQVTYTTSDIPEEKQVDVVMIMLEAFSDLTDLDIEGIDSAVYDDWHALEAQSYAGNLVTNIFAAGTVNTERSVLTGDLWVTEDYTADAGSYVRYLADQGYQVTGSHPIYGWFYNRETINSHLGFESYYFWEERYQYMVDDIAEYLYRDDLFLTDVFEMYLAGTGRQWNIAEDGTMEIVPYEPDAAEEDSFAQSIGQGPGETGAPEVTLPVDGEAVLDGEWEQTGPVELVIPEERTPYFAFHVTYQGHATYSDHSLVWGEEYYHRPTTDQLALLEGDAEAPLVVSDESYYILNNYLGSIHDTIQELMVLVERLASQEEPVVLVLFGDHKPWLGDGNSVYEELGINLDTDTEEGFYNYYSTPYLIWANDAAKEVLGNDFVGEGPTISPAYLMNELFDLCGWEGPAYLQLMDDLQTTMPVVNTDGYYVLNGSFELSLDEEWQQVLDNVRQVADFRRTHASDMSIVTEELP